MPSSARLDKETEDLLKKAAAYTGATKSQLVRESIRTHCARIAEEHKRTPWEIYQSVGAIEGSGHGKRIAKARETLKEKLRGMRGK